MKKRLQLLAIKEKIHCSIKTLVRTTFMLILMMSLAFNVLSVVNVSGHEIVPSVSLRFSSRNSYNLPYLKVYKATTVTDSRYISYYQTAISNWNKAQ